MLALERSKIMLQRQIDEAINPATEPRLRRNLYNDVLNRGVGRPKPQEDKGAGSKKKGGNPADFGGSLGGVGSEPQRSICPGSSATLVVVAPTRAA
jgi:hypothetical protein